MSKELYIGLMSGTSIDAIDAALVDLSNDKASLLATHETLIPQQHRESILSLCFPGRDSIEILGKVDTELGHLFAQSCLNLLKKANVSTHEIIAIGSHGQTIRHKPNDPTPFTLQIGDPNIIAAITNITTVADFRRRDLAHGGEAAPLAPAFHHYLLKDKINNQLVINIGGIANITYLPTQNKNLTIGFDTGPGNTLLDAWCWQHQQRLFDKDGTWAKSGTVLPELLSFLLNDSYFHKSPPKSTGREYFNLAWLNQAIKHLNISPKPEDVQATLLELTALSISYSIDALKLKQGEIWLCGGGAYNHALVQRLIQLKPNFSINTTDSLGIAPKWIEACAFAWLAKQTMNKKTGNLPSVTGAKKACILGAIYTV